MNPHEIVLLQGAQSDLLSIYSLLGERTYARVDKALGLLKFFPEAGPLHFGTSIRRLVVAKTPLGIFYSITSKRVLIAAVLDLRQSPKTIKDRLQTL